MIKTFVLVAWVCGFGCGESSHYEQFPSLAECWDRVREIDQAAQPWSLGGNGWYASQGAHCERGATQHNGQTWSADGSDPWSKIK